METDALSQTRKVLIIEDDPITQALLATLLRKLNFETHVANNADEALAAVDKQNFDLIFMDVGLPGPSGIAICEEIRKREHGSVRRTLVVALTARNAPEDRQLCLDAGMDGFFTKPIDRIMIMDFLRNLF